MNKHLLTLVGTTVALVAAAASTATAGTATSSAKPFKLPYAGSTSSSRDAFSVTDNGAGNGIAGHAAGGYGTTGSSVSGTAGGYGTTSGGGTGCTAR